MINAVEMCSLRKICGVKLTGRIRIVDIRERLGMKESIGAKMKKGLLRWFGHVERMSDDRMTKQIYNTKVVGKRGSGGRGRSRYT